MQRHWKILQWITSGWNCRGGFSVSLRRDEGCIYLCFLLRPVGFCFSKILHLCHLGVTKSACPTDAEKCPPTAICPYSRWRSQPLSRVSRKQRYNTLDFLVKVVCHETAGFFGFFQSMGNTIPSEHPRQRETLFPFEILLPTGMLLVPIGNPTPKELPLWNTLMSMHQL